MRQFAFAAGDLLLSIDASGRILQAAGDATLLHHPTVDRLESANAFDLICEGESLRLREELWALGPGNRISWEDPASIEGGRRILIQRDASAPDTFLLVISRMPRSASLRGDRAEDILADRFRDAVMNGRLKAALQPVVETRSGAVSHYEVLARFDGEESPVEMINAAEKTGQISHLDYIMIHGAAGRLAGEPDPGFCLSVNISGESLQNLEVIEEFCAVIAGHGFQRNRMTIELTESAQIRDIETAARAVARLRASGISVSLDDFGSGSASFGYLRELDVDQLKFDGSFLHTPERNLRGLALMRNIARMCAELGIVSVGEKVETATDRRQLLEAGVRYAQGFYFGTPQIDETFFARGSRSLRHAA